MIKNKLLSLFIVAISLIQSIPSAYAQAQVAAAAATETGSLDHLKKFFDSPMGVVTIAGIATAYSSILYKAAGKQEEESKNNIKKIDKLIASYKDSNVNNCPKGRDDLSTPSCYCYLSTGAKNSNRSNSQVCIDLWAKGDYTLSGDAANYANGIYNPDVAGCVNVNGQFDETCKCKKFIDSSGNNACKKEASITLPNDTFSTAMATSTGLKDLLKYSANTTNGNPGYNLLSTGNLTANAIRNKQITDQLTTKLPPNTNLPKINESNVGKYAVALMGEKALRNAMASNGGAASYVGSSRSNNPAVENLLKKAQEKVGIDVAGSGKGLENKKEGKKPGLNFNFAEVGSSGAGQVIQDFPEENKNYKYKNSDIVTDNSASIFEIISNRYIQSGLKRLFEEPQ